MSTENDIEIIFVGKQDGYARRNSKQTKMDNFLRPSTNTDSAKRLCEMRLRVAELQNRIKAERAEHGKSRLKLESILRRNARFRGEIEARMCVSSRAIPLKITPKDVAPTASANGLLRSIKQERAETIDANARKAATVLLSREVSECRQMTDNSSAFPVATSSLEVDMAPVKLLIFEEEKPKILDEPPETSHFEKISEETITKIVSNIAPTSVLLSRNPDSAMDVVKPIRRATLKRTAKGKQKATPDSRATSEKLERRRKSVSRNKTTSKSRSPPSIVEIEESEDSSSGDSSDEYEPEKEELERGNKRKLPIRRKTNGKRLAIRQPKAEDLEAKEQAGRKRQSELRKRYNANLSKEDQANVSEMHKRYYANLSEEEKKRRHEKRKEYSRKRYRRLMDQGIKPVKKKYSTEVRRIWNRKAVERAMNLPEEQKKLYLDRRKMAMKRYYAKMTEEKRQEMQRKKGEWFNRLSKERQQEIKEKKRARAKERRDKLKLEMENNAELKAKYLEKRRENKKKYKQRKPLTEEQKRRKAALSREKLNKMTEEEREAIRERARQRKEELELQYRQKLQEKRTNPLSVQNVPVEKSAGELQVEQRVQEILMKMSFLANAHRRSN